MQDDALSQLKAIGFNPAVDDSVRVRALTRVAELELKRWIAGKRKSGKIPRTWMKARSSDER
jgi:hypothetical protein